MKYLLFILFVTVLVLSINISVHAQEAQGNIFIVTNFERAFPENVSGNELDSLTQIFMDNNYKNNEYVVSYKAIRHFWGHDNKDFIQIVEVRSWEDVIKASEKSTELFEQTMPNKADRDNFNKAFNKYFSGKHSDEIYQEVVFK